MQVEAEALPNLGVWDRGQDSKQRSVPLELLNEGSVPITPAFASSWGSRPAPASLLEEKVSLPEAGGQSLSLSIGSPEADSETRNPVPVVYVEAGPWKHEWRSGQQDRRRKGFGQGRITKFPSLLVTGA